MTITNIVKIATTEIIPTKTVNIMINTDYTVRYMTEYNIIG
jgi:hypothetical protein